LGWGWGGASPRVGKAEGAAAEEDGGVAVGGDDAGGHGGRPAVGGAVEVAASVPPWRHNTGSSCDPCAILVESL
jgi:hypothetical protein